MRVFLAVISATITLASPLFWGWLTQKVMRDKNYDENWFWWGFFFGIIALTIAIMRPPLQAADYIRNAPGWMQQGGESEPNYELLKKGGWECRCGKVNPSYVGTCACGTTRDEMYQASLNEREN